MLRMWGAGPSNPATFSAFIRPQFVESGAALIPQFQVAALTHKDNACMFLPPGPKNICDMKPIGL